MTTALEPGIEEHPDIQGLNEQEQTPTPRRRGRPKGSKNKPRETTTASAKATAPRTPRTPRPVAAAPKADVREVLTARVVLVENGAITIVTDEGTVTYAVESKYVLDRRSN